MTYDIAPTPVSGGSGRFVLRVAFVAALVGLILGTAMLVPRDPFGSDAGSVARQTASGGPTRASSPGASAGASAANLRDRVTAESLRRDLAGLEAVVVDGDREVGRPGYEASVTYVTRQLRAAGYRVDRPSFDVPVWRGESANTLSIAGPAAPDFREDTDFGILPFSPSGTVTGTLVVPADPCAADPVPDATAGEIPVLIPELPCPSAASIATAAAHRPPALILGGRWFEAEDVSDLLGSFMMAGRLPVPIVAVGIEPWPKLGGLSATITVNSRTERVETRNVVAELPGSDPSRVVVVGAHLDSVAKSPGIDDDGTGVAAVLELARLLTGSRPVPTIRFALWAAEENGLWGSRRYVESLSPEERHSIELYLSADMLGAPNGTRTVYSSGGGAGTDAAVLMRKALAADGLRFNNDDPLTTRTDALAFKLGGIPTAGVASVSGNLLKTNDQIGAFGGYAGPMDPCYHQPCDRLSNLSLDRVVELTRALAAALEGLAYPDGVPTATGAAPSFAVVKPGHEAVAEALAVPEVGAASRTASVADAPAFAVPAVAAPGRAPVMATTVAAPCPTNGPSPWPGGVDLHAACVAGRLAASYTKQTPAGDPLGTLLWVLAVSFVIALALDVTWQLVRRRAARRLAPVDQAELWLCPGCRSFNHGDAPRCYRCRAPRPDAAATVDPTVPVEWKQRFGHPFGRDD